MYCMDRSILGNILENGKNVSKYIRIMNKMSKREYKVSHSDASLVMSALPMKI